MSLVELEDSGCTSTCGDKGIRGKMGNCSDSDSTSSIGKNSDATGGEEDSGESSGEVESPYKGGGGGGGLDAMEALEEVLPIRRGISRFYNGKSKSFASLARASSIQDLAKSENAFTRRRRNLLASSLIWDKNRFGSSSPLRSNGGGISKKTLTNLSRTNLALAVAMTATSSTPSNTTTTTTTTTTSCLELESDMNLVSPTLLPLRKPKPLMSDLSHMHRDISTWRSFSLADLQRAGATTSIETPTTPHSALAFTTSDEPMPFLAKLT